MCSKVGAVKVAEDQIVGVTRVRADQGSLVLCGAATRDDLRGRPIDNLFHLEQYVRCQRGLQRSNHARPRPLFPTRFYLLHPWSRVLRGTGTSRCNGGNAKGL